MQEVVTPDDSGVRIRKHWKSETHLLAVLSIYFHGVDADRCDTKAARIEVRKLALKTPQLGVTERSPVAAVEDQYRALRRNQIRECDLLAVLIRQRKLWRLFADAWRRRRSGHLTQHIEKFVSEKAENEQAQ